MEITSADLAPIRELYGRGLYMQAYQHAQRLGPIHEWKTTPARLLGGRLVIQLGAPRLGRGLHLWAYRNTPTHHEAIYYHARYRLEQFGPLGAWQFMRRNPEWNESPPEVRADWYGLYAFLAARLRDFDRAERWLQRAETMSHDRAWLCIERAAALEFAERFEEALENARKSMTLQPWFRPGVQAVAHILQLMGREKEALDHLMEASEKIESGIIVAHLAGLEIELGRYTDARRHYDRYAELSPMMEPEVTRWLAARRCDVTYFAGDRATSREQATITLTPDHRRKIATTPRPEEEFYQGFISRLTAAEQSPPPQPIRVRLDQDESAAAKLPGRFFDLPEGLVEFWGATPTKELEDGSTFDGLPNPRERRWAEAAGLRCVEFDLTAEIGYQLLERGIPFLLTLVDAGYSHAQLVVGFDRIRESFWIRDPGEPRPHEAPIAPLLKRYLSVGPRCLVVIPQEQSQRLDGLNFPNSDKYERLHELQSALLEHDRPKAVQVLDGIKADFPNDRLTALAWVAIVRYDANPTLMLQAINELLKPFPDDTNFLLSKINILRDLGRREERLELARSQVARRDGDPIFAQHFAQLLMTDPNHYTAAVRAMRDSIRRRPHAAPGYYILANVFWEQREFHDAEDLYRFAASLDDRDEQFAEAYFRAARVLEHTPEAMRFLQTRFNRTKGKSAAPGRALFYALSEQEEMTSAFDVLEQVLTTELEHESPQSAYTRSSPREQQARIRELGESMLFLAEMRTNYNESDLGQEWLTKAEDYADRMSWLRTKARIALVEVDLATARQCWDEVLKLDPLSIESHRNGARVIADLDGKDATVAWLRGLLDKHTHFHPLLQLLIDWLRGEPPAPGMTDPPAVPIVQRLIDQCPQDAWAYRELALHLANHGRAEEAFPVLDVARSLEPDSPSYFYTFGHLCFKADQFPEAKAAYEEAIRRSVDNEVAISELVMLARGDEEKKETLQFIANEFIEQPNFGDGLLTFRDQAVNILEPDDLLRMLRDLLDDHSELWQCWSTTIQQLIICQRLEEANELAKEAVSRFPLLARLWLDLAEVREAQSDSEGRIEALQQAVAVAPGWSFAARELAEALEADQRSEESRVVLEQSVARSPLDPINHGYLADNLWNANEGNAALDRLKIALRHDPGYDWAWRALGNWSERVDPPEDPIETTREITRLRPGDPRGWLALARMLNGPATNDESLHALDRAIALHPRSIEAYDLKSERLAEMGRFDEARATATPVVFENDPPLVLQGRAAWVEAKRGRFDVSCREMRALVTLEPNYYWGWQQLAEWYNETGKSAEYLEAAEKLTELRPDSPVALAMRGEAKLRTEDREGGKNDLREAQKLAPDYSFAGMLLFDAHLEDEEFDDARRALALLQEHIGDSGRAYVAARHVQIAVRQEDEEAALAALRDACVMPCDSTWPINTAVQECRNAGWSEQVDETLRAVLEEDPEFHPYTLFVWLDGPDGQQADVETRLRIVSRVIEVHPRDVRPHDVKAEMLSRAQRYDEALAACKPPSFGDHPPLILRGRYSWILAQKGEREKAIASMREILQSDPDYYWGWQQIANWYDAEESHPEYLEAAENLVRLAGNDPAAYGYRGEAKLFGGDRRGAKADFHKAFDLDPNYAFAGLHLVDEQLADDELDGAQATLARLEEHVGGPYVSLRAVRLAVKQKDEAEAREHLAEMGTDEECTYLLLNKAADGMTEAGWGDGVLATLTELLDDEEAVDHVGRIWAERCATRPDELFEKKLPTLLEREGEIGNEALFAGLEALAQPSTRMRLHRLIQTHGEALRKTNSGWARTADVLEKLGDHALVVTWTADWKTRDLDEPWLLHSAALSRRLLDQMPEAFEISKKAIQLDDGDPMLQDHQVWVALEEALAGNTEPARTLLQQVEAEELDDVPRLLHALAESLVLVQMATPGNRSAAFAESKTKVEKLLTELAPKEPNPDLDRCRKRWIKRIAADAGGISAWFWGKWKLWKG